MNDYFMPQNGPVKKRQTTTTIYQGTFVEDEVPPSSDRKSLSVVDIDPMDRDKSYGSECNEMEQLDPELCRIKKEMDSKKKDNGHSGTTTTRHLNVNNVFDTGAYAVNNVPSQPC